MINQKCRVICSEAYKLLCGAHKLPICGMSVETSSGLIRLKICLVSVLITKFKKG